MTYVRKYQSDSEKDLNVLKNGHLKLFSIYK